MTSRQIFRAAVNPQLSVDTLAPKVRAFVEESARLCSPADIHVCDGSEQEFTNLSNEMIEKGLLKPVPKLENCFLARTDPRDVARVESRTVVCTVRREDAIPTPLTEKTGELGNWISPQNLEMLRRDRFPGSMRGRIMYVVPYSMGPIGSPLSRIGIELTDSPYVVASMRIMTRMGFKVLETLGNDDFVRCLHSVGRPLSLGVNTSMPNWPCNPEQTLIAHIPDRMEILSFGSGYGGNSLLGKKCFSLRLGSVIAKREGWLAEHMLILSVTNPKGVKRYIAAAFPSACGKTNLAMLTPTLPGYKVECVGDDICWARFDSSGILRAINPEAGFFGVAPGTSYRTNPVAMECTRKNTIFTNVAQTSDGNVWWEGLEPPHAGVHITDWLGKKWSPESGSPAAHPNSRFCSPASQCKIMDPKWEDPAGVPISAILFGGRRPSGVPLIYESFNWAHGVFLGACMKSEVTAAAQDVKGTEIRHDPFAMKPFFGYNFGKYVDHWMKMERPGRQMPKVFHVNWFRRDPKTGTFLWPGYGENSRVLDWIFRRIDGEDCAVESPIGYLPKPGSICSDGLENVNFKELNSLSREFWRQEVSEIEHYMGNQASHDLPDTFWAQLDALKKRVDSGKLE